MKAVSNTCQASASFALDRCNESVSTSIASHPLCRVRMVQCSFSCHVMLATHMIDALGAESCRMTYPTTEQLRSIHEQVSYHIRLGPPKACYFCSWSNQLGSWHCLSWDFHAQGSPLLVVKLTSIPRSSHLRCDSAAWSLELPSSATVLQIQILLQQPRSDQLVSREHS